MYRDFSAKSRQNLFNLVSQVENEKKSDFTDWFGDRWYDFESWIGKLNIKNYINNVNAYHKKVIDKNNTTKEAIDSIFTQVAAVDSSYSVRLKNVNEQMKTIITYIQELETIARPQNGKFSANFISNALDVVWKDFSVREFNTRISSYVELDQTTGKYTYNWKEIEGLFSRDTSSLTEVDYQILVYTLSTMVDSESGQIDTENLKTFLSAGYTKPSKVTKYDYHESFSRLPNGDKYVYYYVQNKSFMSDALKRVTYLYSEMCNENVISPPNNDLSNMVQTITENFPVIEWRQVINPSREYMSGKLYITDKDLDSFNDMCNPNISISYVDDSGEASGSGLSYYNITTNTYNKGNVRTTRVENGLTWRNDPEADNYSDCTVRLYIGCNNANSDLKAATINADVILNKDYKEFNWARVLTDEGLKLIAEYVPFGGEVIKTGLDIASQTETIGEINSVVKAGKETDLNGLTNMSKEKEKKIDTGLGEVSRFLGIWTKYNAVVENNKKVDKNKETLAENNGQFCALNNLGLKYDTMVVRYEHCSYSDDGYGIKVDSDKNCSKSTSCTIEQKGITYDSDLLRNQYNTIMFQNTQKNYINDSEFQQLETDIQKYRQTGKCEPGSIAETYLKKCRLIDE